MELLSHQHVSAAGVHITDLYEILCEGNGE